MLEPQHLQVDQAHHHEQGQADDDGTRGEHPGQEQPLLAPMVF